MAMINGIQASRVNKSKQDKHATKEFRKDYQGHRRCDGQYGKDRQRMDDLAAKLISLLYPCGIIKPPRARRNKRVANEIPLSEYLILNSFFIGVDFFQSAIIQKEFLIVFIHRNTDQNVKQV